MKRWNTQKPTKIIGMTTTVLLYYPYNYLVPFCQLYLEELSCTGKAVEWVVLGV